MRKQLIGWMTIAVMVMAAAGCSGGSGTDGKAVEKTEAAVKEEEATKETETGAEAKEEGKEEILIAAAASLKNVYEEELILMFQEKYPNIVVKGTYDSSGKLQTQIEEGLEADVFMSAATKQMDALDEEGRIASDTRVDLLENKIVLIVPAGNEDGFETFEDIGKAERIVLGDPDSVPAGQYAREALTNLGLWDGLQDRISLGTNVTEVLNQVAAASGDAGIVYATDAASMSDQVHVVAEAPKDSLSSRVIYPVAVVKESSHPDAARAFVEFLQTQEAMEAFEAYGFSAGE